MSTKQTQYKHSAQQWCVSLDQHSSQLLYVISFHFTNAFVAVVWSQWTALLSASNCVRRQSSMMCVIICCCPHTDTGRTVQCPNGGGWHGRYRGLSETGSEGCTVDEVDQLVGLQFQALGHGWPQADAQASLHRSSVTPLVSTDYMGRQDLSPTGGWLTKSSCNGQL